MIKKFLLTVALMLPSAAFGSSYPAPLLQTQPALTDSNLAATTAYADSAVAVETSRAESAESSISSAALQKSNNLSDLNNIATARTNLGALASTNPSATGTFSLSGGPASINGTTSGVLNINTGASSNQSIVQYEAQGTNKWQIGMQTDNSFFGYDLTNSKSFLTVNTSGATGIGEAGTVTTVNGTIAVTGGSINGTTVGATTPAAGTFTTLNTTGALTVTNAAATVNGATSGLLNLNTGTSGYQSMTQYEALGVNKWQWGMQTDNSFFGYDLTNSKSFLTVNSAGATGVGESGTVTTINGSIATTAGTINGTSVGATTPSSGAFTTLNASSNDALTYTNASAQSIPSGSSTTITGWTKVFDRDNANFNAITGVFTAPATGYYQVAGNVSFAPATNAVGDMIYAQVWANGSLVTEGRYTEETTSSIAITVPVPTTVVSLSAGQTVTLEVLQTTGSSMSLASASQSTYISISRLP